MRHLTGGTTIDTATYMLNITDVGFTRRSLRRYSITVSFHLNRMFIAQSPRNRCRVSSRKSLVWDTEDTSGNPHWSISIIDLEITGSTTDQTEIGRLVFDITTFNADPAKFHVTIGGFEVYGHLHNSQETNDLLMKL